MMHAWVTKSLSRSRKRDMILYHCENLIRGLSFSISRQVLYFCMWDLALSAQTKFHIQKYDGLENVEKPSPALELALGSSTNTNLGHNHTKILKNVRGNLGISNRIFSESSWPLIIFNLVFRINVTRATQNSR